MGRSNFKIAVLSGKGGTGKTLLSVNLASVSKDAVYIDCDVEEPNGHLFFKPEKVSSKKVSVKIPLVDEKLCNGCRKCVEFCNFNAMAHIGKKIIIFEEVCHSCGGCVLLCPQKALSERERVIGTIRKGKSGQVEIISGILNPGEASGVPIINKLLSETVKGTVFIDCPPGSACVVMESIRDADYCILVAEPTLFGVHNLEMVYELVTLFGKSYGAVLNKCLDQNNPAEDFCIKNNIKILGRIPFDKELGDINSNAGIAARESEKYRKLFSSLLKAVMEEVQMNETAASP